MRRYRKDLALFFVSQRMTHHQRGTLSRVSSPWGEPGGQFSASNPMFHFTFVPTGTTVAFATPESKDETLFLLLCGAVQFLLSWQQILNLPSSPSPFSSFPWELLGECGQSSVCVFPPLPGFCAGCAGTHSLTQSLHLRQGCIMNPEKKPHKYLDAPSTSPTGVKKQRL